MIPAEAIVPTAHGPFRFVVYRGENVALVRGDVAGHDVLVRVHSECMTSEVFGSLKCDCALQLDLALARIAAEERGVLVYLRQEGRGIGLANKIRAYALQQTRGLDTVDANRALELPDDARRYDVAAEILDGLGVRSVRLLTNNPAKLTALDALGVVVREHVSHLAPSPSAAASAYLETKRLRMQHIVP